MVIFVGWVCVYCQGYRDMIINNKNYGYMVIFVDWVCVYCQGYRDMIINKTIMIK